MRNITNPTNWLELIKANLPTEVGYEHAVSFKNIALSSINSVLHEISSDYEDIYDFNGCDQDWSSHVTIEGVRYTIWGSLTGGSLCMERE
jgi:hypothetical protein